MKLSKSLTTVTPFSKFLALSLFIIFPICGFFLGTTYQKALDQERSETHYQPAQTISPIPHEGKMCTMEAKECSDGSYVGRTGPNCEFSACPGEK